MENNLFDSINEQSHIPYYVQIKCYLRQLIKEIGPNALVPSDKELADDETVIRHKRLVLEDDEPIAIVSSFLSGRLYHGLELADIGDSLYNALDKKFQFAPTQAHDTYRIAEISPKTAKLLEQTENSSIVYSERLAYLSDGTPAEFVESVIWADKFKIEVDYKSREKDDRAASAVEVNFRI